jgi:hypothetical protein
VHHHALHRSLHLSLLCACCCIPCCTCHYIYCVPIIMCCLDPPYLVDSQMNLANTKLCSLAS